MKFGASAIWVYLLAYECVMRSALAELACKYDFKVYVYPLPQDLPAVAIAEKARVKYELNVCQKCIFVSTESLHGRCTK